MILKIILFTIILTVTLNPAQALEISIDSPKEVIQGEEFQVKIDSSSTESLDVKIFVHRHTKEFSEIFYDEKWKSPFHYLLGFFPDQKEYLLKAHFLGETKICARLRKSTTSNFVEACNQITVLAQDAQEPSEDSPEAQSPSTETKNKPPTQTQEITSIVLEEPVPAPEKIVLSSKTDEPKQITTKQGKTRSWITYSFAGFLIIIIILLALRRL